MKRILLTLVFSTFAFAQSISFDADTIGYSLNSKYETSTQIQNRTSQDVIIDSISIGEISDPVIRGTHGFVDYEGVINISDLDIEIYFGKGNFTRYKGESTTDFNNVTISSYGSKSFDLSKCQSFDDWSLDVLIERTVYYNLELIVHTSNDVSTPITIRGVYTLDEVPNEN